MYPRLTVSLFLVKALYSFVSPTNLIDQPFSLPNLSFEIGLSLSSSGSLASSYFINFYSSTSTPSGMTGLSKVSLPFLRIFWGWWTQLPKEDKNAKLGSFHYYPAGSIYFLSSAFKLNIVRGTNWQLKFILTIWHFSRWPYFPLKWGLVQICFSKSPVKMYLILLEALIWSGLTIGNSFHYPFKRSVATQ